MDAPMYLPAVAFEQPLSEPATLDLHNFSLAELQAMPEAWNVILKHIPGFDQMTLILQPHLGNFTVYSLLPYTSAPKTALYAAINEELRRLPPMDPLR